MPELITQTRDGYFFAALIEGKTVIDLAVDQIGRPRLYQSIWRGRVDRIAPNIGAFINLGQRTGLLRRNRT